MNQKYIKTSSNNKLSKKEFHVRKKQMNTSIRAVYWSSQEIFRVIYTVGEISNKGFVVFKR